MEINEEYFNKKMDKIDKFFIEKSVPIHARPVQVVIEFYKELKVSGPLFGGSLNTSEKPINTSNLTSHVNDWYQLRYANKLNVDMTQSKFPILLNGDVFEVRVPLVFGKVLVACIKGKNASKGLLNPLDMIVDLTDHIRNGMTSRETSMLQVYFETCLVTALAIKNVRNNDLIFSAYKDSFVSCETLISNPKSPELSAWHAVQFAEKILKYFISLKQARIQIISAPLMVNG